MKNKRSPGLPLTIAMVLIFSATFFSMCLFNHSPAGASETKVIRWGTSSVGSSGYKLSAAMADLVNKNTTLEATIIPVGGVEATIRTITRGRRDLGFGNAYGVYMAYHGKDTFSKDGKQPILLIAMGYESTCTFVAKPGINTVEDFKGEIITYRRKPTPLFGIFGDEVLKAHNIDPDKDVKNVYTTKMKEVMDALTTGSIDVGLIPGAIPGANIPQLQRSKDFNIIDIGEEKAKAISREHPFFKPFLIKANTFKTQDKDVYTLGFVNVLFCHRDLPENVIYEITKAIFSNRDKLIQANPLAKRFDAKSACTDPVIPLHPGAIKYYKEAGVLD